jgi:hypothetical protein
MLAIENIYLQSCTKDFLLMRLLGNKMLFETPINCHQVSKSSAALPQLRIIVRFLLQMIISKVPLSVGEVVT